MEGQSPTERQRQSAAVQSLTAQDIIATMDQCDAVGVEGFLRPYGFRRPDRWVLRPGTKQRYPAKATVAIALGRLQNGKALSAKEYFGGFGEQQAFAQLKALDFEVVGTGDPQVAQHSDIEARSTAVEGPYWFVGANFGRKHDQLERFVRDGIWEIDSPQQWDRDRVLRMLPGQRIAIKSTFVRWYNLPFDNHDKPVSCMAIKAIGTITANPGNGESISVDWEEGFAPREWYHYTYQPTIWEVYSDKEMARRLIAFAFNGEEQDYDWFLANLSNWKDVRPAPAPAADAVPDRRKRNPVNLVLYGPPGTGKTYRTMAEAVRLALGLDEKDAMLIEADRREDLRIEYERLVTLGQIGFATFHQNYGYEDFVEGLRPKTGEGGVGFDLVPTPGVLSKMAKVAAESDEEHVLIIDEIMAPTSLSIATPRWWRSRWWASSLRRVAASRYCPRLTHTTWRATPASAVGWCTCLMSLSACRSAMATPSPWRASPAVCSISSSGFSPIGFWQRRGEGCRGPTWRRRRICPSCVAVSTFAGSSPSMQCGLTNLPAVSTP